MTDHLDSRALRHTDTYGQRFMKPGTYRYDLVPAGATGWCGDHPYVVEVTDGEPKRGELRQTLVTVRRDGSRFVPDQPTVQIHPGDMVMWHGPDGADHPFAVVGEKEFLGSGRLVNECGYTHAFTAAGTYAWADAHGSGVRGVVRVSDPDLSSNAACRRWQEQQRSGTVVMVRDGAAEPAEVEVVVGQTVFFAVVSGPGITVTDLSLLEGQRIAGASFHRPHAHSA